MQFAFLVLAVLLSFFFPVANGPGESSLAIIQAGVQPADDAPFVTLDYHFLPGDYIYVTFDMAGFTIKTNPDTMARRISLAYTVTPEDMRGRPLASSSSGTIAVELAPEDKHWTPKRRASFLLPSDLAAGKFRIHIVVKDSFTNKETEQDLPFSVGGVVIQPSDSLTVENFHFFRKEGERKPLDLPAYSAGASVYVRFDLVGFRTGPQNQYRLSYGITVLRPDGRVFLEQPKAAKIEDEDFYPAQFVPAGLHVNTSPKSALGQYTILLKVHDLIANQTYETKQTFTLE